MKRFLPVLIAVLFLMPFLCSCSVEKTDKKMIRYTAPGFPKYDVIRRQQGKEFMNMNPDMRTDYQPVAGVGYIDKLLTQFAGNDAPDIFFIRDFDLPTLAGKGAVYSLDDIVKETGFDVSEYFPELIDAYTFNDRLYALPGSFTTRVLYYNRDLFDEMELPYPDESWDWEKFREVAQKLTKRNASGITTQFGAALYSDAADMWVLYILQNGGRIFDDTGRKCIIRNPEAVQAIKYFKDLITKYHVIPDQSDIQGADSFQIFVSGRAAMFIGGRWYVVNFREKENLSFGIAPLPKGKKRATFLDSHGWAVTSSSKDKAADWVFLSYLAGQKGNRYVVDEGDSVPVYKKEALSEDFLRDKKYPNEDNKVFIDSIGYAYPPKKYTSPFIPWNLFNRVLMENFDKFTLGEASAEETLQNIEDRLNDIIAENLH
ncbi:MAG: sugar ABC transporter substrate-binding protein [Candidatus Aureabacteria bacterium]|nr:sugar ABC transporter substrate-binding protein [Candidatus Auribacterota bacterium]